MRYNFDDLKQKVEYSRKFDKNKRVLPEGLNKPVRDVITKIFPDVAELFDDLENAQFHDEVVVYDEANPLKNITFKYNYGVIESFEILTIKKIGTTVITHKRKCKNENIYFPKKNNNNKPYQGENK